MSFLVNPYIFAAAGATQFELDILSPLVSNSVVSFADRPIGEEHPDRYILVFVAAAAPSGLNLTAVTIGGVAATLLATHNNGGSTTEGIWAWIAHVPTGTTATISVTTGATIIAIQPYRLVGILSATAHATNTASPLALAVPANGVCLLGGADISLNLLPTSQSFSTVWNHRNFYSQQPSTGTYGVMLFAGLLTSLAGLSLSSTTSVEWELAVSFEHVGGEAVPDQMTGSHWYVLDKGTGGTIQIVIIGRPAHNGSLITGFEYQIDGGSWTSLGINSLDTGSHAPANSIYEVSGLTDDVEVDVAVRAVNEVGAGTGSATEAVTPTNDGVWTYLGAVSDGLLGDSGGVFTLSNVPIGADDANRFILLSVGYRSGNVSGSHNIASMTLGGVAGTRVARATSSNETKNVEHWKFNMGAVAGATATLTWTKGGSITTPDYNVTVASFYHAGDADGPELLQSVGQVNSGSAATVTTTSAGDVICHHVKSTFSGTPIFVSTPTIPTILRTHPGESAATAFNSESIVGHRKGMPTGAIAVSAFNTSSQALLATVWSAP